MQLHIFNPEHDIALAHNLDNFVPPHAARELRADLGFLPALWANDGDLVLVDNIEGTLNRVRHISRFTHDVLFITPSDLPNIPADTTISPWGWDKAMCHQLVCSGFQSHSLPTNAELENIRQMSNRQWAAENLLRPLVYGRKDRVGEATFISNVSELPSTSTPYVLKAPWSSSGRGIRYVDTLTTHQRGWAKNVISKQGGVMKEPYYHKIKDFALEFSSTKGGIRYKGLSLFNALNGAYMGNIIATEKEKADILNKYIPFERIEEVIEEIQSILSKSLLSNYIENFGIDMMIVDHHGLKLHPCVELNLRQTMGHVALSFNALPTDPRRNLSITYDGSYHLRIQTTAENCYPTI